MKNLKRAVVLTILTLGAGLPLAHASKIIGNGGNVLVCEAMPGIGGMPSTKMPTQMLDFYEAENLHNLKIQDPGGSSYSIKVDRILSGIEKRFPKLGRQMRDEFADFELHRALVKDAVLSDTVDSFNALLPRGCHIEQIAIQRPPMFPRDPWYMISRDLWDDLDELNKAGLVVHEVLYHIGLKNGIEHSKGVRYLVGFFFSTERDSISDEDWIAGFRETRIRDYNLDGIAVPLFMGDFKPCEPEPGKLSCSRVEDLKTPEMTFSQGALVDLKYDQPQWLPVEVGGKIELKVMADRFHFNRGLNYLEVSVHGSLHIQGPSSEMGSAVIVNFNGSVHTHQERVYGLAGIGDYGNMQPVDYMSLEDLLHAGRNMIQPTRPPTLP